MDAIMLLCDFAEVQGGKLYIMGGGWSEIRGDAPVDCAVALRVGVPWTQTNQRHKFKLALETEDGQTVMAADDRPVAIEADFEVGRPPGTTIGADLVNTMSFRFGGLPLPTGRYLFSFSINGTTSATSSFAVYRTQGWEPPQ